MEYNAQPAPSTSSPVPPPARQPEFRIRYGRTALALAGASALLVFVVGGALALAGAVSGRVPGFALLAVAAVVVILRSLAVRDRSKRAAARARQAAPAASASRPAGAAKIPGKPTELFDGAAGDTGPAYQAAQPEPAPLTAAELREEALKVAADAGDTAAPGQPSGTPWQPVDVPKPTYVAAAKATRPAPAPLPVPEVKKPQTKTSIKQTAAQRTDEAAARTSEKAAAAQQPADGASAAEASAQQLAANRINLDDVLQRRRA